MSKIVDLPKIIFRVKVMPGKGTLLFILSSRILLQIGTLCEIIIMPLTLQKKTREEKLKNY